jgi:hypothetical protein
MHLIYLDMVIARADLPFGLRPPRTHMHCYNPFSVLGSTKMFPKPKEYMCWHNTHFLLPYCRLGHTLHAYVLLCAMTLPLFGALCESENKMHKFMRLVLHYQNEIDFICLYKSKA